MQQSWCVENPPAFHYFRNRYRKLCGQIVDNGIQMHLWKSSAHQVYGEQWRWPEVIFDLTAPAKAAAMAAFKFIILWNKWLVSNSFVLFLNFISMGFTVVVQPIWRSPVDQTFPGRSSSPRQLEKFGIRLVNFLDARLTLCRMELSHRYQNERLSCETNWPEKIENDVK